MQGNDSTVLALSCKMASSSGLPGKGYALPAACRDFLPPDPAQLSLVLTFLLLSVGGGRGWEQPQHHCGERYIPLPRFAAVRATRCLILGVPLFFCHGLGVLPGEGGASPPSL